MKKDVPMEMMPMVDALSKAKSITKTTYSRCARGTRRNKKYHYCRSLMRKKCGNKSKRNRKTGKCEASA
jgi:hypothetical protein